MFLLKKSKTLLKLDDDKRAQSINQIGLDRNIFI